jgi:hypothetical protein
MSAMIDPKSHLNLDYPDHKITFCVIAKKFSIGSSVKIADEGFVFARVDANACKHFGQIDYTKRLTRMIDAVKKLRVEKAKAIANPNRKEQSDKH